MVNLTEPWLPISVYIEAKVFSTDTQRSKMMIGESTRRYPTVQIPSWDPYDDMMGSSPDSPYSCNFSDGNGNGGGVADYSHSPILDSLTALHRYLPSNEVHDSDPVDAFSCDQFRMYEFKVRRCARGRSHDWTECPFAHPGEKARRRDPRRYHYSGTACNEFRKGSCKKGDSCEFSHGVFECWLHPARYRTQPCKDGMSCRRRVCFFAHSPEQLRVLAQKSPRGSGFGSGDVDYESPMRHRFDSYLHGGGGSFVSSPTSILASPPISPPSDSPPMSPDSPQLNIGSFNCMSDLVASMRGLQLEKARMGFRGSGYIRGSMLRPGFCSLPTTPTGIPTEEPAMERVESGRNLRASMYAKLSKENSLRSGESGPDVGWVTELVM